MNILPTKTGVMIETQDGVLDLAQVTWQAVAPCGCISGVTLAACGDDLVVTAEQAGRQFASTTAEYQQDIERGFSWRPREHRAAVDQFRITCPHSPRFGYEKPPTPEGYVWATPFFARRAKYLHLVPREATSRSVDNVKSMCRRVNQYGWSVLDYYVDGKVECKRCIDAANRMAVSA